MMYGESPLRFGEVLLGLLTAFYLPLNKTFNKEEIMKCLKKMGARWAPPNSEDFETAEEFLLPEELIKRYYRVELDGFSATFQRNGHQKSFNAGVFLTIYPKLKVGILTFNLELIECDVDDIIFIQHSWEGRFRIGVEGPLYGRSETTLKNLMERYLSEILEYFNIRKEENLKTLSARCIEIRSVLSIKANYPRQLLEEYVNQMYGILVADEGWRFVPSEEAKKRLKFRWRSRTFFDIVCFDNSVMMISFEKGEIREKYTKTQTQLREMYGKMVERYFTFSPKIAGLNHGPLLMLEIALAQKYTLKRLSERTLELLAKKSLKELLNARQDFLQTFLELSHIKIPESGFLLRNIYYAMDVQEEYERATKLLSLAERALTIRYSQLINRGMLILTILLSFLTVINTFISIKISMS
jgi:hypothetical protein